MRMEKKNYPEVYLEELKSDTELMAKLESGSDSE